MNERGWYCWSTETTAPNGKAPGGGPIELVQAVHATRGHIMKINEAAQWMLDRGVASLDGTTPPADSPRPAKRERTPPANKPLRVDLVPKLSDLGTHPEFVRRGIGAETCRYLRCGYLAESKTPLAGRIVFQVGGIEEQPDGALRRIILSHSGRALTSEQNEAHGKWWVYAGFNKTLELYNIDNLLSDPAAAEQARATGHVLLVEGPFDVAKLVEAGIRNVVSPFGAHLAADQLPRLFMLLRRLGVGRLKLWFDRDAAGNRAAAEALLLLAEHQVSADAFDWNMTFADGRHGPVTIPDTICDPCEMSVKQIRWLRARGIV